jgi:hypothetical protein
VIRVLLGGVVVAHGLLTALIWLSPPKADAPFRATHSWLIGDARSLAIVIALVAAAGFVLAGSASSPIRPGGRSPGSAPGSWRSC